MDINPKGGPPLWEEDDLCLDCVNSDGDCPLVACLATNRVTLVEQMNVYACKFYEEKLRRFGVIDGGLGQD